MSIYHYAANSTIKEAVFHHAKNRQPVALLTAAQDASPDQLSAIRVKLDAAGWQSVPVYNEGHAALQVSGFSHESELSQFLHSAHFTQGEAEILHETGDDIKPSFQDRVRHISLNLAGLFNLVGNTLMVGDGVKKRDPYRIAGGSLLTLGAVNLVRYGNTESQYYQHEIIEKMADFIRHEGVPLPQDSRLFSITEQKRTGLLNKAENFLYRYPAQVTLGIDSVGSTAMLASGIKKIRNKEGWGGLGFGITSLGLKLTSLIVPEKTRSEREQSKSQSRNIFEKAVDWIQEKPLRFYGIGSLVGDVFLGVDAYQQYRRNPGKKGYILTAISGTSYTLADIMYSISSKNHVNNDGKFTADEQRGLEAMAAETLVQQPEVSRSQVAQKVGNFLHARKEVQGDARSISQSIIEQARHMQDNPWVVRSATGEPGTYARSK